MFIAYLENKSVIDLGCGDGAAYQTFKEAGIKYLGVDINANKLAVHKGKTIESDMLDWLKEQPGNSVANIFTHHALEHLAEPTEVLSEIARVITPGGFCFNTVPYGGEVGGGHFSIFTEAGQLLPPNFDVIYQQVDATGYPEIKVIGRK
jgi:ubiquinone/menaquinone biosynthesis C-methylase UbiE